MRPRGVRHEAQAFGVGSEGALFRFAKHVLVGCIAIAATAQPVAAEPVTVRPAAPQASEAAALAARLAELHHFRGGAEKWREMLASQTATVNCDCRQDEAMQARIREAWSAAVAKRFDSGAIVAHMQRGLAAAMTADELADVVRFSLSPLGQKLYGVERPAEPRAQTREQQLVELGQTAKWIDGDGERKAAMLELMQATGVIEAQTEALMSLVAGMSEGATAALPEGAPRPSSEDLGRMVDAQRTMISGAVKAMALPVYASTYRGLSVAEIREYAAASRAPAAQTFIRIVASSLNEALKAQALAIGAAFVRDFRAERS